MREDITGLSGRRNRLGEAAVIGALVVAFLFLTEFITFRRYQPPEGTDTVDRLIAHQPETQKFAVVRWRGRDYVVWIGRPRGVAASGPPVYVFDRTGVLVDRVYDVGDSDNAFVGELCATAFRSSGVTPEEAAEFCRRSRDEIRKAVRNR